MSELNTLLSEVEPDRPVALRTVDTAPWWEAMAGEGDRRAAARDALITHYAPLVTQVATRVIAKLPDTVELGDLVSYGMFGLIDAVEKFEAERGFKFETYAATRIRGAIIDELRAADWVPRSVRSKARTLEHATRTLEQQLLRPVTDEDVAEHLGWATAEVRTVRAQVALSHVAALDGMPVEPDTRPIPTLGAGMLGATHHALEARERSSLLAVAVQGVRDREQEVLRLYYYENLTLAQIGEILGVTESRVSQIHSAAVKKLRETLVRTGAFD
ncbi:FliA/WhiG family RNA polymerase sigma factor [Demequina sp. SYSU T00039]|uniref:RNA polymerase sigma factor n=1 Tax=Demequina lignilytica TaxID=3051663 RepID=A0AAW7M038_9MICO|nr:MULTISPECIES: FliA/WhiG family RNA polymerase sigma factor [unclassified Demequina]MDN4477196.1 FliA/WhiG family RNA polymerase sigma factor [Demequina sp. SYSU T00039-1]MDN4487369.1 FliA/WhiG family RNA polymerase sigma factor [Demequina sp. SYSU T00039]MDN4491122.1 FliA/WhiG family RNA polymerase sigma factor [Demequina sp. SYSU T00068]